MTVKLIRCTAFLCCLFTVATAAAQQMPVASQEHGVVLADRKDVSFSAQHIPHLGDLFLVEDFMSTEYGSIPRGWQDLFARRPSRNWGVDDKAFLRPLLKERYGMIAYEGLPRVGEERVGFADYVVKATFKKDEDDEVSFGVAGRIQSPDDFYQVQVVGDDRLVISKVQNGKSVPLTEIVLAHRYVFPQVWELTASFYEDLITGIVRDENGRVVARADGRDGEYENGTFGLHSTDFTGAGRIMAYGSRPAELSEATMPGDDLSAPYAGYHLIRRATSPEAHNTPFETVHDAYDIVVAGAGTGGWAASVQAARLGRCVLLMEETDWIGGQMAAAAVTSMDESGPQVRERGIYREFHESMVLHYYGMDKSPFKAYYWSRSTQNQHEGGYEPKAARAMLYGFIEDARRRASDAGRGGCLDVLVRARVVDVQKEGDRVTGVRVAHWDARNGERTRNIRSKILVDATEYGDVIPLTSAAYRVGNTRSDDLDLDGAVQKHTYTAVLREYPGGIPEHLVLNAPPPGYDEYHRAFRNKTLYGDWGLHRGRRMYRAALAWRGMADSEGPLLGRLSQWRHTMAGINGPNDYPVSVATIETPEIRLRDEREGIYRTLSIIYYMQQELGAQWSVVDDQGFATEYNRMMMQKRGVADEIMPLAQHLPQMPYVRESRRVIGIETLVADDLSRWENARHVSTSVAMGDYFMDLHGTYEALERDLDDEDYAKGGGPFQIPFEVFIPKTLDGFLPAEKNFSQSRLASGATRLQPITMLTGQAVGTMAALAVEKNVQPRELNPLAVQLMLLDAGSTLIQRWHSDVTWGTELWKAVQLLSLYEIMDRSGPLGERDGMQFTTERAWGRDRVLTLDEAGRALKRLAHVLGYEVQNRDVRYSGSTRNATPASVKKLATRLHPMLDMHASLDDEGSRSMTHGEFALMCLRVIRAAVDNFDIK